MATVEQIKTLARAYCAHTGLEVRTLSHRAFDDGKKLAALLEDRTDLTLSRFDKTLEWFSANWPADLAWPDEISRPPVVAESSDEPAGAA